MIFCNTPWPSCKSLARLPARHCKQQISRQVDLLGQHDLRFASSSSSKRWQARHAKDHTASAAKVQGLKSRAAFKLLELILVPKMNDKYRFFKPGQTVVDLGFAPGSWSQVALDRTHPTGRVLGIDIIPAQPPRGVSTIQGNFLSTKVQAEVRHFLSEWDARSKPDRNLDTSAIQQSEWTSAEQDVRSQSTVGPDDLKSLQRASQAEATIAESQQAAKSMDQSGCGTVDIILSDMSEPWAQTDGFFKRSLSDPYHRMMNTSGLSFKDHAGSMDLCQATLQFATRVLKAGGHLVCKFYAGAEDKSLERQLKLLFHKVHREKPESSRSESRETYFVALKRRNRADGDDQSNIRS